MAKRLAEDVPTIVGIDHGLPFPLRYFEVHRLPPDWLRFLEDLQRHWPKDAERTYVDFVRDGLAGNGAAHSGHTRWRRMTEQRAGSAKSVFRFDVQGLGGHGVRVEHGCWRSLGTAPGSFRAITKKGPWRVTARRSEVLLRPSGRQV